MIVLWVILSIILLFLVWLLIAPIQLYISSPHNIYCLKWKGIAQIRLIPEADDIHLQFQIAFWKKDFYPLQHQAKSSKKQKHPNKTKNKSKSRWTFRKIKRKAQRLFQSFDFKAFDVNLDTDDYIMNAYLYPIFFFLSKQGRRLNINYQGELSLHMIVENRLYRILTAILL